MNFTSQHITNRLLFVFRFEANNYAASEHGGTHMDAPVHFWRTGWTLDEIPPERFVAHGTVAYECIPAEKYRFCLMNTEPPRREQCLAVVGLLGSSTKLSITQHFILFTKAVITISLQAQEKVCRQIVFKVENGHWFGVKVPCSLVFFFVEYPDIKIRDIQMRTNASSSSEDMETTFGSEPCNCKPFGFGTGGAEGAAASPGPRHGGQWPRGPHASSGTREGLLCLCISNGILFYVDRVP